jgi:hypothetical protein
LYPELGSEVTMENIVDRLLLLSATRCGISRELEFIASYFYAFLCRRDGLIVLPFSMISEIIGHASVRIESGDSLYDLINKAIETKPEMFGPLEFIRLDYCSADVMSNFLTYFLSTFTISTY